MLKLEGLKSKQENGITVYFYAGLGWVTEERLKQPDVAKNEAVKNAGGLSTGNSHVNLKVLNLIFQNLRG